MEEQNQKHPALQLFDAGYGKEMIPVIPPGATLSSGSKIRPESCGKIPGMKGRDGTWHGFAWQTFSGSRADIEKHIACGASFGLRTTLRPFIDVDVDEKELAEDLATAAAEVLGGVSLRRYGRAPRCAIPCRTVAPFRKEIFRLIDTDGAPCGAIEISGEDNQVVVHGTHPKTGEPYSWTDGEKTGGVELLAAHPPESLPLLTLEMVHGPLREAWNAVAERHGRSMTVGQQRQGVDASQIDQALHRAPSLAILADAVRRIPNDDKFDRPKYIGMLYAIRAAAGPDHFADGLGIALEWADRWTGGDNDPARVERDYDSCSPPSQLGWDYISRLASANGFDSASLDFTTEAPSEEQQAEDERAAHWAATASETERIAAMHQVPDRAFFLAMEGLSGEALWKTSEQLRLATKLRDPLTEIFQREVLDVALNLRSFAAEPATFEALLSAKLTKAFSSKRISADGARLLKRAAWVLLAPIGVLLGQRSSSPGTLQQPGKSIGSPRQWVVDGWIPQCGVVGIVGAPGAGKSFVVADLGFHVATPPVPDELTGTPEPRKFAGRKVTHGSVVYCGSEDVQGWMERVERRAGSDIHSMHLYVASRVPPLSSPAEALQFAREIAEHLHAIGAPPLRLLIIDVLKAAATGDENSAEAMGVAMGTAHALSHMLGATVALVHHSAVAEAGRARGSSVIEASLDAEFVIVKKGDTVGLAVKKNKGGPSGETFQWQLGSDGVLREGAAARSESLPVGRACTEAAGVSIRTIASESLFVSREELKAAMVAGFQHLFVRDGKPDRHRISRAINDACRERMLDVHKQQFRPGPVTPESYMAPGDLEKALSDNDGATTR